MIKEKDTCVFKNVIKYSRQLFIWPNGEGRLQWKFFCIMAFLVVISDTAVITGLTGHIYISLKCKFSFLIFVNRFFLGAQFNYNFSE